MQTSHAAADFLARPRWAVVGVSREGKGHGANVVYQRLRERGYEVYAVNPNAETAEGDPSYRSLSAIPGAPLDVVMIGTRADRAPAIVDQCLELGVRRVWMHRSFGPGSVSRSAVEHARGAGVTVIDGGCPCMFAPTDDSAHRVMRRWCTMTGASPRSI